MKNHGELVQPPRPLASLILQQIDGGQLTVQALRGKWTLVYLGGAACLDTCNELLYHLQQIRWALGEDMQRVQRLYLVPDDADAAELRSLARRYPGMLVTTADPGMRAQIEDQFGSSLAEGPVIYLVDPLGNVMMRYGPDLDAKGVLQDLERLLKVSRVG
jgi:cytochrome oxidase Cu insertion factor (SCO1/SenC/PrrC family)